MLKQKTIPSLIVLIFAVLVGCSSPSSVEFGLAGPSQAKSMIENEGAIMIDVREKSEYAAQHIVGTVLIPLGSLKSRLSELEQYKGKPIIMQCRSGARSARASAILVEAGFDDVFNLSGGIKGWVKAGLDTQ